MSPAPRPGDVLAESLANARSQLAATLMVVVLAAAMCAAVLATVGRNAAAQEQVRARLDQAGSRFLVLTDVSGSGLLGGSVRPVASGLDGVERAIALGAATDFVLGSVGAGSAPVPVRTIDGLDRGVVDLVQGRWPGPGEAIIAVRTGAEVGLANVGSYLTDGVREYPVVGTYRARAPFEQIAAGALVPAAGSETSPLTLAVLARSSEQAAQVQAQVLRLVAAPDPTAIQVLSPATLAQVQGEIGRDVAGYGGAVLALLLLGGGALVAVVVFCDVLVRRRDLGRRRALGATRSTIVAIVVLRTAWAALLGVLVGTGVGLAATVRSGAVPPASFVLGTAVLALLCAVVAAVLPAVLAALRDPVAVLRTP